MQKYLITKSSRRAVHHKEIDNVCFRRVFILQFNLSVLIENLCISLVRINFYIFLILRAAGNAILFMYQLRYTCQIEGTC